MGKTVYKKLKGSQSFRQRLLLSTLSSTPITIEDIRPNQTYPGLAKHEISLLRLFDTVSDGCTVEIYETGNLFFLCLLLFFFFYSNYNYSDFFFAGTKLKYKPGTIMGGRVNHPFQCDFSRSIGYYLEPLIVLCLFAKEPLNIRLKGCSYTCSSFLFHY